MSILQQIPQWFKSTAAGKAMIQDEVRRVSSDRKQLAEALAGIDKEEATALPPLAAARAAALAKRQAAQLALDQAVRDERAAFNRHAGAVARFESRRNELRQRLADTAPAAITTALARLEAEAARLRHAQPVREEAKKDWLANPVWRTNRPALTRRMLAITGAREATERLRYRATTTDELTAAIDSIWSGLPSADILE